MSPGNFILDERMCTRARAHNKKNAFPRIMMTESYSSIDIVMKYYGDGKREGSHIPFNFLFIEQINNNSNANDYKNVIDYWMNNMPANRIPNWVVSTMHIGGCVLKA